MGWSSVPFPRPSIVVTLAVVRFQGKDNAGVNGPAIHDDRTGATFADAAPFFGSGEAEIFPQHLKQGSPRSSPVAHTTYR